MLSRTINFETPWNLWTGGNMPSDTNCRKIRSPPLLSTLETSLATMRKKMLTIVIQQGYFLNILKGYGIIPTIINLYIPGSFSSGGHDGSRLFHDC